VPFRSDLRVKAPANYYTRLGQKETRLALYHTKSVCRLIDNYSFVFCVILTLFKAQAECSQLRKMVLADY